jgi:mersacidin/lichenicidin family type 2 lantibiotic
MSQPDIIRAWRDVEYRLSLSEAEIARIPPHPAGYSEILNEVLMDGPTGSISPFSYLFSCMAVCQLL